ncbi:MAG: hypothetical protein ABR591_01130 [Candidatus Velthaea sp.]
MDDQEQNPIVAMAMKIRARRDLGAALDSAAEHAPRAEANDAESSFAALAGVLAVASKRLNSILGKDGVRFIRIEHPLRIRLRFRERRAALDLDCERQLVRITGAGLDGEYQFDTSAEAPALINLSKLSTEAGYGERLTGSGILKQLAQDAELPRPPHLERGPLQF